MLGMMQLFIGLGCALVFLFYRKKICQYLATSIWANESVHPVTLNLVAIGLFVFVVSLTLLLMVGSFFVYYFIIHQLVFAGVSTSGSNAMIAVMVAGISAMLAVGSCGLFAKLLVMRVKMFIESYF